MQVLSLILHFYSSRLHACHFGELPTVCVLLLGASLHIKNVQFHETQIKMEANEMMSDQL
jgi:hypothetical protein